MNPKQAKLLARLLAQRIADYERHFGQIPMPQGSVMMTGSGGSGGSGLPKLAPGSWIGPRDLATTAPAAYA